MDPETPHCESPSSSIHESECTSAEENGKEVRLEQRMEHTQAQPSDLVEKSQGPSDGENGCAEDGWLEREDHPLRNNVILETLLRYVRRFDLKACRVVCKRWNIHTIPHMRATFKVTIQGSQSSEQNGNEENENTRRIDDFVKLFSSNELGIPFTKFQLGPFRTTDGVGKQFLQLCGETATVIALNGEKYNRSKVYMIEDISEILRASPTIQSLTLPNNIISRSGKIFKLFPYSIPIFPTLNSIAFRPDYERKALNCCQSLIEELLTAATNTSNIVVYDTGDDNGIGIAAVLNAIEKLGMESSIQSLDLYSAKIMPSEQLRRMGEKENGLKLKSLTISPSALGGFDIDDINDVQLQLATYFEDSLHHLSVARGVNNNLMEFPFMPQLKSLDFWIFTVFDSRPVNLNKKFPVLETFAFQEYYGLEGWDQFFSRLEPCPTIKSVNISSVTMKAQTVHDILIGFPNLTKLSLSVHEDGEEVLKNIWCQLTELESLAIRGRIETECTEELKLDSLFTGISTQELEGLTHVVNELEDMTIQERRERILKLRNEHCRLLSIANLTKLRHLDLDLVGGDSWGSRIHLSDVTAYFAFYSMNQLRHLNVARCRFTKTSCEILKDEIGHDSWKFQNTRYENIIHPFLFH